ncbi:MAG TPA: hypothetical protein VM468_06930, partial [Mycoplana sp.]|nr:hypothetical protein [Mycoplana sp.]
MDPEKPPRRKKSGAPVTIDLEAAPAAESADRVAATDQTVPTPAAEERRDTDRSRSEATAEAAPAAETGEPAVTEFQAPRPTTIEDKPDAGWGVGPAEVSLTGSCASSTVGSGSLLPASGVSSMVVGRGA